MTILRLNSAADGGTNRKIEAARQKRKLFDDIANRIKKNLDWLLVEMEDFESGELDDSYEDYIVDCISIFNRAMQDVADVSYTLRDNIKNLD